MSDYLASAVSASPMAKNPQVAQTTQLTPNQVKNNAGGFVYESTPLSRLNRFLIIGTDGGTYYQSEKELTIKNCQFVVDLIKTQPADVAAAVYNVSTEGRALRQGPTLMVWALLLAYCENEPVKDWVKCYTCEVARTGTMVMQLAKYIDLVSGWGTAKRKAIAGFYESRNANSIAYQVAKYPSRFNWTHRDLLRKVHPAATTDGAPDLAKAAVYDHMCGRLTATELETVIGPNYLTGKARAFEEDISTQDLINVIEDYSLAWEMIPTDKLNDAVVLDALVPNMRYGALLRNLNRLTWSGWLEPNGDNRAHILQRLVDQKEIDTSRIHPFNIYMASRTYGNGQGMRGNKTWNVVSGIADALDDAFLLAFNNMKPIGGRHLVALDVSGSMVSHVVPGISAMEASAALATITLRTEANVQIVAFSDSSRQGTFRNRNGSLMPVDLGAKSTINSVQAAMRKLSAYMTGTDCSLPFTWAQENNYSFDHFSLYTDNETYAGKQHPSVALNNYRRSSGINANTAVVAMSATPFTIADPNDTGMLDVVGLDTNLPGLLSEFFTGF